MFLFKQKKESNADDAGIQEEKVIDINNVSSENNVCTEEIIEA